MSLATTATYPNGKAGMFNQDAQELRTDFFDEFLTFNPGDGSESLDFSEPPASTYLEENSGSPSNTSTDDEKNIHPWAGESWIFPLNAGPQSAHGKQLYAELSGRAAISDSELLSLEGITLESPHLPQNVHQSSLPSSPTSSTTIEKLRRKNRIVESLSKTFRKAHKSLDKSALRSPIRKSSQQHSPRLSRSFHDHEVWSKKLDVDAANFTFELKRNSLPLSPPPSAKLSDPSMSGRRANGRQIQGFAYRALSGGLPAGYHTPATTPRADMQHAPRIQRPDAAAFPSTPTPHSRSYSPNGTDDPSDIEAPMWWNHAASSPMAQPSPASLHTNPRRASMPLAMQLHNEAIYHTNNHEMDFNPMNMHFQGGLMIQMPPQNNGHPYVLSAPPMMNTPQMYFPTRHVQSTKSPRTRTPSESSDSASPTSPSTRVRSKKPSKHSKPRGGKGMVDFVNYTPHDSRKILTGVAPSGSNKTKARREREAEDKRRRLSQAAVRAVRAAGGDVESLVEEGLFF